MTNPILFVNSANSRLLNAVLLSETTTSGSPRVANDLQSSSIVAMLIIQCW